MIAAPWDRNDANSRLLLELIAQSTNDGIWELDFATNEVYYSPRWMELIGYQPGELPGHYDIFYDRIHPDDRERVVAENAAYVEGSADDYRVEFRLRHKDGSWRWIQSRGVALRDAEDRPTRFLGTHTDITERVHAAERLEQLVEERTAELRAARDRAETDAAATIKFLAAASHDIRQPLQAMALLLGSLAPEVGSDQGKKMLRAVEGSLGASMELLDALLEFSRLDAGALRPFVTGVAVGDLIDQAADAFAGEARSKGIRLTSVRTNRLVLSDAQLLARIIRNLLSNALKYTDRGRVLIGCRRHDGRLWLEVWDTGRGIAPGEQRAIFWEFYRIKIQDGPRGGLGLGLAIVDRLARLLKHPIHVRSWPGQGSVFAIDMETATGSLPEPIPQTSMVTPDRVFLGKLVALLEDDAAVAEALEQLLMRWGMVVIRAAEDSALLAALAGRVPDFVIADRHLALGRDGFEAFDRLDRIYGRRFPGLVLTGDYNLTELEQVNRARRRILQKPVWPAVLHAVLRGELSRLIES